MPRAYSRGRQASCRLHASRCCSRLRASRAPTHALCSKASKSRRTSAPKAMTCSRPSPPRRASAWWRLCERSRPSPRILSGRTGSASSSVRKRSTSTSCRRYSTRSTDTTATGPPQTLAASWRPWERASLRRSRSTSLAGRVDHSRRWAPCVCVATSTSTRAPRVTPTPTRSPLLRTRSASAPLCWWYRQARWPHFSGANFAGWSRRSRRRRCSSCARTRALPAWPLRYVRSRCSRGECRACNKCTSITTWRSRWH